jgi:DNA invertase Pin-like site-specific DNA recombinase
MSDGETAKTVHRIKERSFKMKTVTKLEVPPGAPRKMRVCAYARVSSGKDAMRRSLFAQISYYGALIRSRVGWEFAGVYADDATSGTKDNRAEFCRMLEDCREGKIDMVITKSLTRFARNTLTTLETVRELKSLSVDVYFEKENIHSVSHDGELMLTVMASYAQEESRSVSENCKWRIRKMFEAGRPSTGNLLGYRLIDGRLRLIEDEAIIVRQIFADYLSGMGKLAIAKKLNRQAVPTMHGGPWRETTVANILCNEKYAGDLVLQKFFVADHIGKKKQVNRGQLPQYLVTDSHEAIIDRETFAAVREETARRALRYSKTAKFSARHVFTGLIRCGICGGLYGWKMIRGNAKYSKAVWICHTFNTLGREACPSGQIPENILIAKGAEALGVECERFDESLLRAQISEILVPAHNRLLFVFRDGHTLPVDWENPSRRHSWTPEMKQAARERECGRLANAGKSKRKNKTKEEKKEYKEKDINKDKNKNKDNPITPRKEDNKP